MQAAYPYCSILPLPHLHCSPTDLNFFVFFITAKNIDYEKKLLHSPTELLHFRNFYFLHLPEPPFDFQYSKSSFFPKIKEVQDL